MFDTKGERYRKLLISLLKVLNFITNHLNLQFISNQNDEHQKQNNLSNSSIQRSEISFEEVDKTEISEIEVIRDVENEYDVETVIKKKLETRDLPETSNSSEVNLVSDEVICNEYDHEREPEMCSDVIRVSASSCLQVTVLSFSKCLEIKTIKKTVKVLRRIVLVLPTTTSSSKWNNTFSLTLNSNNDIYIKGTHRCILIHRSTLHAPTSSDQISVPTRTWDTRPTAIKRRGLTKGGGYVQILNRGR
ncbi:hypothetical protein L2E82_25067 [Cichorium intybus]|uniref:Uncharacterized protein n=1 Tax=Cichorium intybus TaxID=13427 RepID=A0ACB9E216_CICIN|nr:hypothetical protein L2E82_25067 [Cichorium intybus]